MISRLSGKVIEIQGAVLTLDVSGVGYEVYASRALLERVEVSKSAIIVVFTDVKEDSIRLFGFVDALEKQIFLLLLKVSGVGTRTALDVVSGMGGRDLLRAIGQGDTHTLQGIRGVGKKTAERMVLELRDKTAAFALDQQSTGGGLQGNRAPYLDAIEALQALGFSKSDAEGAVRAAEANGKLAHGADPGLVVKEALRYV